MDALVAYKHPVFVYIPPNGELRGGAWVVIDPTINEEVCRTRGKRFVRGGGVGVRRGNGVCCFRAWSWSYDMTRVPRIYTMPRRRSLYLGV